MTRAATEVADGDHFAAYLRWDIRAEWKRREKLDRGAREYPYAYGSNWKYFNKFIKPNTTLWIVAAPVYRAERTAVYRLPPTLIARLLVECVDGPRARLARQASPEDYVWVARADRARSEYLPINNAFYALTAARFVNSAKRTRKVPPVPPPPAPLIQRIRTRTSRATYRTSGDSRRVNREGSKRSPARCGHTEPRSFPTRMPRLPLTRPTSLHASPTSYATWTLRRGSTALSCLRRTATSDSGIRC